jgi:outer membrane protein OmpA-like peptidoglycan-associated protein
MVKKNQTYDLWADADYFHPTTDQVKTRLGKDTIDVVLKLVPVHYKVKVIDNQTMKPIAGAKIEINLDCTGETINLTAGANGTVEMPVFKDCNYKFRVKSPDYLDKEQGWKSPAIDEDQLVEIQMQPFSVNLRSIYYDFDKADLRVVESFEDLNKIKTWIIEHPEWSFEIISHTDARGSFKYNDDLSNRRAQSVVDWLRNETRNLAFTPNLTMKGMGEHEPVNHCTDGVKCSEEEHQFNRRTEVRISLAGKTLLQSEERIDINVDPCLRNDCDAKKQN